MKKIILIPITLLFLTVACRKKLCKKSDYNGTELKTNGYYYKLEGGFVRERYFFYKNGSALYPTPKSQYTIIESDDQLKRDLGQKYKSMFDWAVFKIDGSSIEIERILLEESIPRNRFYGTILNDTTFVLTETYLIKRGKKKSKFDLNDTFHFREFYPKLDSTTKFIKK
jgi:hypothetical protein